MKTLNALKLSYLVVSLSAISFGIAASETAKFQSFTYDEKGLLIAVDGERTDVQDTTRFEYNDTGNLVKIINPLGQTTLFSEYIGFNKPATITGPNGVKTNLTYDTEGRIAKRCVKQQCSYYEYDNLNQMTVEIAPNGNKLSYKYDELRRLTSITNNADHQFTYEYDSEGNLTQHQITSKGNTYYIKKFLYDEMGRLRSEIDSRGNETKYTRDPNGNIISMINARNAESTYTYNRLNQLSEMVDPKKNQTANEYNDNGELIKFTDQLDRSTSFEYDGFGYRTKRISPDTGMVTYEYDLAGNLISSTDARGIRIQFAYDALNRVVTTSFPDSEEDISYQYDDNSMNNFGIGNLFKVTEGSGVTEYVYNEYGLISAINKTPSVGSSYQVSYEYNASDQITQITYPSGRKINYIYDELGQVSEIYSVYDGVEESIAGQIEYLPFGPLSSLTYGNGLELNQTFDKNYQIASKLVSKRVQNLVFQYNKTNQIRLVNDRVARKKTTYQYDLLDRLTRAKGFYGTYKYQYDAIGNRTKKIEGKIKSPYRYQNGILQSAEKREFKYDESGNIVSDGRITYQYNQAGRIKTARVNGIDYRYGYNFLGQRVSKSFNNQTPIYQYGIDNLLLSISDENGRIYQEFIYLNGKRIALTTHESGRSQRPDLYFIHTNHIDTPLAVTNYDGKIAWQTKMKPFGEMDIVKSEIKLDLRFPGQLYDSETGTYYNYFRDYDPELGRYIQSDPIGLAGGINTYGYALQNPIKYTDPYGLDVLIQTHNVIGSNDHSKVTIIPLNQARWANDPRFSNTLPNGDVYLTIGAGPSKGIFAGELVNGFNRKQDRKLDHNLYSESIFGSSCPTSDYEDQVIQKLLSAHSKYPNNLNYDFFPEPGTDGYNSNSYISGLLHSIGFPVNAPPRVPGFDKPVPYIYFK